MVGNKLHIGIVGGVGPFASALLYRHLTQNTIARQDQDHHDVTLISYPARIPDRTAYLLRETTANPLPAVLSIVDTLISLGANVIGIPCNTMHAPEFLLPIQAHVHGQGVQFVDMIEETVEQIQESSTPKVVCALTTAGAAAVNVFGPYLRQAGLKQIVIDERLQSELQEAIYAEAYGLKSVNCPPSEQAEEIVRRAIDVACARGADRVILGCTELSTIESLSDLGTELIVDPLRVLAVRET